jgi:hypothetical protein
LPVEKASVEITFPPPGALAAPLVTLPLQDTTFARLGLFNSEQQERIEVRGEKLETPQQLKQRPDADTWDIVDSGRITFHRC